MNLETMNTKQLRLLRERINAAIEVKQREAKAALREQFKRMAAEAALDLSDIVGGTAKRAGKRMRDPKTGAIWAGIGRAPKNFDRKRAVPA